jgi:FkbM family methyltransferase
MLGSWLQETRFALGRTGNWGDAARLLGHTAHFHLANRGILADASRTLPITVSIGDRRRRLAIRTGRIGDLFVLYEVLAAGVYRLSPALVAPAEVAAIIDCGANIGLTALYFAAAYPSARIYSVEADPESFALLKANTQAEPRIVPIHACIVAEPQETVTFDTRGPAWGRKAQGNVGVTVPATTLDELLSRHAIPRVDLLKVDIEGAERDVLAAGSYLDSVGNVVAELHGDFGFSDFAAAVGKHGLVARPPERDGGPVTAHRRHPT